MRVEGVQQNEAWKSLNPKITQTMKYPLASMTLNEEEWKHIMKPIVKSGITKDVISSTLHKAVTYGHCSLGGIGSFEPFVIQGAGQIVFLITEYWKLTPSSPLLWVSLCNLQLEPRRGKLENEYAETQQWIHTESWMREVRKFMSVKHINISHIGKEASTQRTQDACIM